MFKLVLVLIVVLIAGVYVISDSCTFPFQTASDGSSCGGRSAWSR